MSHGLPQEGTRRLQLGLGGLALAACFVTLVGVLALHGPPYWAGWWGVMLVVLALSFFTGRILAPIFEWIIVGYRGEA
jgi:hypothetical protein